MFTKPATSLGPSELASPVADAGAVLQFYSYILDTTLEFEAFLNSYDDTFNSNWSSENVYGRQDPIYTFQNTQRTIGVSFTVPNVIHPKEDATKVSVTMDTINKFFQFLYPRYEQTGNALTISQAPLVRVKFANMIANSVQSSQGTAKQNGLLTTINSISMNPKIEHGFSRLDLDGNTLVYPNFIDLSLGLSVVHETGRFGAAKSTSATAATYAAEFGALDPELFEDDVNISAFPYGAFSSVTGFRSDIPFSDQRGFAGSLPGGGQIFFDQNDAPGVVFSPDGEINLEESQQDSSTSEQDLIDLGIIEDL